MLTLQGDQVKSGSTHLLWTALDWYTENRYSIVDYFFIFVTLSEIKTHFATTRICHLWL